MRLKAIALQYIEFRVLNGEIVEQLNNSMHIFVSQQFVYYSN